MHTTTWAMPFREQGQLAEAVAQYQEAIRLRPDYAEAHYNLGIALRSKVSWRQRWRSIKRPSA